MREGNQCNRFTQITLSYHEQKEALVNSLQSQAYNSSKMIHGAHEEHIGICLHFNLPYKILNSNKYWAHTLCHMVRCHKQERVIPKDRKVPDIALTWELAFSILRLITVPR